MTTGLFIRDKAARTPATGSAWRARSPPPPTMVGGGGGLGSETPNCYSWELLRLHSFTFSRGKGLITVPRQCNARVRTRYLFADPPCVHRKTQKHKGSRQRGSVCVVVALTWNHNRPLSRSPRRSFCSAGSSTNRNLKNVMYDDMFLLLSV